MVRSKLYQFFLNIKIITMEAIWKQSLDTQDLIKRYAKDTNEEQMERYLKQIGKIWEIFEIKTKEHSWSIAKNHNEIQQFIIRYNLKFKAKLVFGQFMMRGVRQVCQNIQSYEWIPCIQFFEISDLQMKKVKSVKLLKKSGGRYKDYFCCRLPWQWKVRNFLIVKSGILYYSYSKQPKQFIPFGKSFKMEKGKDTGYQFGIIIQANHRKLLLYAQDAYTFFQFIHFAVQTQKQVPTELEHRYNSFSPIRTGNRIQFLVDGEDYFREVSKAIQSAELQIMICGWYISPQFQLIRPVSLHADKRLDRLLRKAAQKGVKIFILVYNESSFLVNDSAYVKQTLQSLSENIKVLQHPLGVLPTFWSHHQKLVIVDQKQAFMGGLDLGFARYDDKQHRIDHNDPDYYPGLEYNNSRCRDLVKTREFWVQGVPRNTPRLPWHDVGLRLIGESVVDLSQHFVEYWNYASFQTHYENRYVLILKRQNTKKPLFKKLGEGIVNKFKNIKQFAGQIKKKIFQGQKESQGEVQSDNIKQQNIKIQLRQIKYTQGSSDSHTVNKGLLNLPKNDESSNDATSPGVFRLRQQSKYSQGNLTQAEGFIQAGRKARYTRLQLDQIVEQMQDKIENFQYMDGITINKIHSDNMDHQPEEEEQHFQCQILRSVGSWSIGCHPSNRQSSIHTAYLDLIREAKRFIYIQNQFFLSNASDDNSVKNLISYTIFQRIERAVRQKQKFKVWILIPLIPGFAGELDDPEAIVPRVIMHWQYNTIYKGTKSLLGKLRNLGVDPSEYVRFYGLRTHGVVADHPKTELIYVHSKLMIIDDEKAICGSANINQRSMRGSRDSQLCILIEGGPKKTVIRDDQQIQVSQSIHNLRVKLFQQHFGEDIQDGDLNNDEFCQMVYERVSQNTKIYRQIFHCYPDDGIKSLKEISAWKSIPCNEVLYYEMKDKIQGNAVEFPLQFLKNEDLLVGSTLYPDSLCV